MRGDLGDSAAGYAAGSKVSIWSQVEPRLSATLWLAGITALLMIPLSLLLGVVAARHAGRPADVGISLTSLAVISLPEFVIGSLLILVLFSWLDRAAAGGAARSRQEHALAAEPARPARCSRCSARRSRRPCA